MFQNIDVKDDMILWEKLLRIHGGDGIKIQDEVVGVR